MQVTIFVSTQPPNAMDIGLTEQQWRNLCAQHPPEPKERDETDSLLRLLCDLPLSRLRKQVGSSTDELVHSAPAKDPFTGLPPPKRAKVEHALTPAAQKKQTGMSTTQYRKLLMGKALDRAVERPPPFHTQVSAFGMRASSSRNRGPSSGYSATAFAPQYSSEVRRQPSYSHVKAVPSTTNKYSTITATPTSFKGADAQTSQAPQAVHLQANATNLNKACTLCEERKPALQHTGGSRYCRSCESLRWECRKIGVRLPALRQAMLDGKDNIVDRATEIQKNTIPPPLVCID